VQQYLLPILCDAGDPHYFDDPEAFIDFYSARFVDAVKAHDRDTMPGWSHVSSPPLRDASRLSRKSRKLAEILFVGEQAWCKGMRRSQYIVAINAAAFAIMKGEPVPKDPIHGLPYIWDPVTRVLSAPSDPIFKEMKVEPLTVPRP